MFKRSILALVLSSAILSACGSEPPVNGAAGPAGESGSALTSVYTCSKIALGVMFQFSVAYYSEGERVVTCSISDASAQYTNTVHYMDTQAGYSSSLCLLTYDMDASTGGYWSFTKFGSGQATYNDASSGSNNTVVSGMTCVLH